MPTPDISLNERIIFALDVPTEELAQEWVKRLLPSTSFFKVGLELFLKAGFGIVDWIADQGGRVMLDLKFYDVPVTVQRALNQLSGRGIVYATVHGESAILKAAAEAQTDFKVLAVTVLTSMSQEDVKNMGIATPVQDLVLARTRQAVDLGVGGVVCSGQEAERLRSELGPDFAMVTPGIRPAGTAGGDDQRRVVTAGAAIASGATNVVVGRPIRDAADPIAVIEAMKAEIADVL